MTPENAVKDENHHVDISTLECYSPIIAVSGGCYVIRADLELQIDTLKDPLANKSRSHDYQA